MVRLIAAAGVVVTVLLGAAAVPATTTATAKTQRIKVHCRSGDTPGFVTPNKITVNVGDDIEWSMAGNVDAESLEITLKDETQSWPFQGLQAKGRNSARTGSAVEKGTYSYNVRLKCKVQGGEPVDEVIDPDIIIL